MLIKPDKPPSQTTSYRPIGLLSAIMKLFERVIEKCLRKHLEDNGFFSKYQSGFRKSKSTNDHLFRLSQTIMESFYRGEHAHDGLFCPILLHLDITLLITQKCDHVESYNLAHW